MMPVQALGYPQNHSGYRPAYPSRVNRQAHTLNRYSRFDSQPVALHQAQHQTSAPQNAHKDFSLLRTALPSIAPETDASKRFSFFD